MAAKWLYRIWLQLMDGESFDSDELVSLCNIFISIHESNDIQYIKFDLLCVAIKLALCIQIDDVKFSFFRLFLKENYSEILEDYINPNLDTRIRQRLDKIEKHTTINGMKSIDIIPYIEILNIISADSYNEMPEDIAQRLYKTAVAMLYSEYNYIIDSGRITALKIMIVLVGRFKCNKEKFNQIIAILPQTDGDNLLRNNSPKAVAAGIYLLRATLGTLRPAELLLLFPNINDDHNVNTTIDIIRYWIRFCGNITRSSFVEATLQYVVSNLLRNDQSKIRSNASLVLVELYETKYDKFALDMISQIIDSGVPEIETKVGVEFPFADKTTKEIIIFTLKHFKRRNPRQVKFLLAKAQSDTSWSVRNAARNVEDKH